MSTKLTLILSGRTLKRTEFDEFERLRIGRNDDCDLVIDNLGISRYHCEIVRKTGYTQVRDLASGNGTFVNGQKVESYNLNNGDMISLGKFTIKYESEKESEDPNDDSHRHVPSGGGGDGMMTLQMDAQSLAKKHRQQMSRNRGHLKIKNGSRTQDLILEKSMVVFGKQSDADIILTGWFCPRVVAILIRDESGFRIVDVSPKGKSVLVNGIHKRDTWLNDNDLLVVRGKKMNFHRGLPVGR